MRTNTSIPHIFSGKGACVRHVLDEYNQLTTEPDAAKLSATIRSPGFHRFVQGTVESRERGPRSACHGYAQTSCQCPDH